MIPIKKLGEIVNYLKCNDIHKKMHFSEILTLYAETIDYYRLFMQGYSHCLKNYIYVLCLLVNKLYITWALEYNDTNNIKIDADFINNKILTGFSDQGVTRLFKNIISGLLEKDDLDKIKEALDNVNGSIEKEIKNELVQISIKEIQGYCPEMESEYIISRSDNILYYEDLSYFSQELMNEQLKENNIPDTTKDEFFTKYPEFEKALDKHGLINLSFDNYELIKRLNLDGVYYKDYFIYFDKLLGFRGENLLYLLIDEACNNLKVSIKIKLDYNKIISLKKFKYVQLVGGAYYGPPYNPDKFFIKKDEKPSLTIKIREPEEFYDYIGNNISRTEFCFDPKNNSFLIEEIGKNKMDGYYINRLVHSEFNITNNTIKHFDGSVLFYDISSYSKREKSDLIRRENIEIKKEKIFQIDGEMEVKRREEFLLSYYQCNEMILEYLDEDSYKEQYEYILKLK